MQDNVVWISTLDGEQKVTVTCTGDQQEELSIWEGHRIPFGTASSRHDAYGGKS